MNTNFKQSSAYELADKLEKSKAWLDSLNTQYKNGFGKYCLLPNDIANMLRQQADRIAKLEKEADRLSDHANELRKVHADKISELEKQLNLHKNAHHKCVEISKEQADRIAELEKQLAFMEGDYPEPTIVEKMKEFEKQSEPVAWIKQGKYGYPMLVFNGVFKYDSIVVKQPDIPLYTTLQTKPLSDEEIKEIALKVGFLTEEDLTPEWAEYTQEFIDCVRAIEAKVRGQ